MFVFIDSVEARISLRTSEGRIERFSRLTGNMDATELVRAWAPLDSCLILVTVSRLRTDCDRQELV